MKQSAWVALGVMVMAGGVAWAKARPNMVLIPAHKLIMTRDKGKISDVATFFVDRTEVTVEAYAACVDAGKCTPAKTGDSHGFLCNAGVAGREKHPITCVNWDQADAYCKAQGKRLPTEEEWEYAATGVDGRTYPWGNAMPSNQLCWNGEGNDKGISSRSSTCAVGAYPKGRSPFGIDDMAGNVFEWTSTQEGLAHIARGGSWDVDDPSLVRSAFRGKLFHTRQDHNVGFRCADSAP